MLNYFDGRKLEVELRFVQDQHDLDFSDAFALSGKNLYLKPTSMGFSVIKISLPGDASTVESVCVAVSGAQRTDLLMWQKDPDRVRGPGLLVDHYVRQKEKKCLQVL